MYHLQENVVIQTPTTKKRMAMNQRPTKALVAALLALLTLAMSVGTAAANTSDSNITPVVVIDGHEFPASPPASTQYSINELAWAATYGIDGMDDAARSAIVDQLVAAWNNTDTTDETVAQDSPATTVQDVTNEAATSDPATPSVDSTTSTTPDPATSAEQGSTTNVDDEATSPATTTTTVTDPTQAQPTTENVLCDIDMSNTWNDWTWKSISFGIPDGCTIELEITSNILVVPVSDPSFFDTLNEQPRVAYAHDTYGPGFYTVPLTVVQGHVETIGCQLDVNVISGGESTTRTAKFVDTCGEAPPTQDIPTPATCHNLSVNTVTPNLGDPMHMVLNASGATATQFTHNGQVLPTDPMVMTLDFTAVASTHVFSASVMDESGQWMTSASCEVSYTTIVPQIQVCRDNGNGTYSFPFINVTDRIDATDTNVDSPKCQPAPPVQKYECVPQPGQDINCLPVTGAAHTISLVALGIVLVVLGISLVSARLRKLEWMLICWFFGSGRVRYSMV